MADNALMAIRNSLQLRGKAHLDNGFRGQGFSIPECGVVVNHPESLPWENTDPGDRCKRCAKRAEASRG